ncbi:hypothetical protein, partial [Corallococcus sp. 4LFB]|uniref:hypothetical protein n=1 Tax=Corallococcus sp. 4LFB TaxID=3383249 RepID=UPI0039767D64
AGGGRIELEERTVVMVERPAPPTGGLRGGAGVGDRPGLPGPAHATRLRPWNAEPRCSLPPARRAFRDG